MSGINERAAARIMKDVLGEASCKTDVLANIVPQLRNGNGAEALKDKNCEPAKIDGCNASVIETTYAPYPGLRGVLNNEESANNIVSEDCVDDVVQEDIKKNYIVSKDDFIYIVSEDYIMQEDSNNVVPLINEKSAALRKNKNKTGILEAPKTSNLSGGAAEAAKNESQSQSQRESQSQNQSQKSGSQNHCQGQSQSRSQNESQSRSQRESRSQNQSQKSGSQNHCQGQSQSQSQRMSQSQSQRKPGDVRQDVRHPRNPRVITISETAGSSAELRLRRRAQGGCAVEGYTRATSNRATTTMRRASATTTMRLWHADRRSRGMCCQGRIEKRRTESRTERLQREDGSVVRPLRGPL